MMTLKNIALIVIMCFSGFFCVAQQQRTAHKEIKYRAIHWTIDQGLAKDRWHMAMLKDINGFLWVGSTHGEVSRFDGNTFQQYDVGKKSLNDMTGNHALSFIEDSLHNMWVGRADGLSRYDVKANTFTDIVAFVDTSHADQSVVPFWATSNELYCIEGGIWITTYNIHSFTKKKLLDISSVDKIFRFGPAITYTIYDSSSNSVWMLPELEEGLVQLSLSDKKITRHLRTPYKINGDNRHRDSEAMRYDRNRNCIWINSDDGLTQFTLSDKQFHHIDAMNPLLTMKGYDRWVGIDMDPHGRIWLATIPKGIIVYDPATQVITDPIGDSATQAKVMEGNLKIYCDRDGIVWTSYWSFNGIYQLVPFSPVVHRYGAAPDKPDSLSSRTVQNMVAGPNGNVWIGTPDNGMNIYNPETGSFSIMREKDLPGMKGRSIIPMAIDTVRKKAWLNAGPPEMVYIMDIETRTCKPIVLKDTANRIVQPVNIINFVSCSYKDGLLFYDAGHGIFESTGDSAIAHEIISCKDLIYRMFISEDLKLFIKIAGTRLNYTYKNVNGKWVKTTSQLDSLGWTDIAYDNSDHSYWVAADKEIIRYDNAFKKIRTYTDEDGLISLPISLLPDGKGNIWFHTDRNVIAVLNTSTGVVTNLSIQDGYQKQSFDLTSTPAKAAGGYLYFVGNFFSNEPIGLDRVSPADFVRAPSSKVYIRSLNINQKLFPMSIGVNNVEKLSLRYFENRISIETGIINHFTQGRGRIRYKLDKMDTSWQYAPYYYTIRYEELPAGNYTLLMQASNGANEFNGPIKSLIIEITPAFWNTWWFRILAIVFLVALFYTLIRWRLQQKFRLQLERSEKERQIVDMKQKTTEMEMQALRAQMNPHFIFNSLNSINRFILQNNKLQASEYLTKFSRLVRLILQNSQASLITLESELESLELYLNLEAVRFNDHFEYKISYPKDLDIEMLKVPPLILQPYVENAIWHGLMHKEEKGRLDVEIVQTNDNLFFKLKDNGIGRKKASEISAKSSKNHKSMGLRITASRIAMMQQSGEDESPVKINDLVNDDGTAAGTEVVIRMPVIEE